MNIAHRGASGLAPEHTFAAYDLALASGADYLEQDVHMTRDGVLVVLHDATLDRTAWGRSGWVAELTLEQLRPCDVGSWFNHAYPEHARPCFSGLRVPTLEDVFSRYGTAARYYVELKDPELYPGMEEELIRLLGEHGLCDAPTTRPVIVQSFLSRSLEKVRSLAPSLPLVRLYPALGAAAVTRTLEETARYAAGIGPFAGDVTRELVAQAQELGLEVHPYTVDSRDEMVALARLGVDGLFTNFPGRLASLQREPARDADVVDRVPV